MKCEKCGKEIPDGENKICEECKKTLLNDLTVESKSDTTENKKEEKKENVENNNEKRNGSKIFGIILVILIIIVALFFILTKTKVGDEVSDVLGSNKVGNSIANIRNYGYTTKQGSWIYYIAATEDGNNPAIYKSKEDGSEKKLLYEEEGNILGLNAYGDYLYFILINDEQVKSNTTLSDEESLDTLNNQICRMKLDGSDFEVINSNEFHNNCYEIYVVDDKVYYIGLDTNIYYMDLDGKNKTKLNNDKSGFLGITDDYIILNVNKSDDEKSEDKNEVANNEVAENTDTNTITEESTDNISDSESIFETKIMKRDGSNLKSLTGERLYSINILGNYIYYVDQDKKIYKVKIDGTDKTLISDKVTAYNMCVSDKYIFYMSYTDEDKDEVAIYRLDLDGKNETKIYDLDSYSSFLNLVDGKIVFMDSDDKKLSINEIDKDGNNKVALYELKYSSIEENSQASNENEVNTNETTDTPDTDTTNETTDTSNTDVTNQTTDNANPAENTQSN